MLGVNTNSYDFVLEEKAIENNIHIIIIAIKSFDASQSKFL